MKLFSKSCLPAVTQNHTCFLAGMHRVLFNCNLTAKENYVFRYTLGLKSYAELPEQVSGAEKRELSQGKKEAHVREPQ